MIPDGIIMAKSKQPGDACWQKWADSWPVDGWLNITVFPCKNTNSVCLKTALLLWQIHSKITSFEFYIFWILLSSAKNVKNTLFTFFMFFVLFLVFLTGCACCCLRWYWKNNFMRKSVLQGCHVLSTWKNVDIQLFPMPDTFLK